jgi:hypothetical protein
VVSLVATSRCAKPSNIRWPLVVALQQDGCELPKKSCECSNAAMQKLDFCWQPP